MDQSHDPNHEPTLREVLVHQYYIAKRIDEGISSIKEVRDDYRELDKRVMAIEQTHNTIKKVLEFSSGKLLKLSLPFGAAILLLTKIFGVS